MLSWITLHGTRLRNWATSAKILVPIHGFLRSSIVQTLWRAIYGRSTSMGKLLVEISVGYPKKGDDSFTAFEVEEICSSTRSKYVYTETVRLSKSPLFFPWLVMPLKDFSCLSGAKLTGQKFYPWRHDNWPIGQWVIFHAASDTAYVNQFFPAWIYNVIQIRSGETSRPLDSVARSVAARPHALKLVSLTFRTYERSTCCKSRKRCILRYASCLEDASSTMLSLC